MPKTLVVIPCGKAKIWDREPKRGPTLARDAYIGSPFKVNRRYAERFGDAWVILSAKYGFIPPDFVIPGPYNVTFNDGSTEPIKTSALREQVRGQGLDEFELVISLGGQEYAAVISDAFADTKLVFPFRGRSLFDAMKATSRCADTGQMYPVPSEGDDLKPSAGGREPTGTEINGGPRVPATGIDSVWARITHHAGEMFHLIRGGQFTYVVLGNSIKPDRTNRQIPKSDFARALPHVPFTSTTEVNHLGVQGPSYVYAILMDARISREDADA
jgi:hypothetical protein